MNVLIGKGNPHGEIHAPPSKSYAHRLLIVNGLLGQGAVRGISFSEDILATLDCLSACGVNYAIAGNDILFKGRKSPGGLYKCRESGSTLRFFLPIAALFGSENEFLMSDRLKQRGVGEYEKALKASDISVSDTKQGFRVLGRLKSGSYEVDCSRSSQYASGLLMALSFLRESSSIKLLPPIESKNYLDITLDVLNRHGAGITFDGESSMFFIPGNELHAYDEIPPGDASNAAFLDAFSYLGCGVRVLGLEEKSLQGDAVYKGHFTSLAKGESVIDISNCIDLGPVLMAFASLNHGATLKGIGRLRLKESDRVLVMKEELGKVGARVDIKEDEAHVSAAKFESQTPFSAHNDHRIAMALSLFLCRQDVKILSAEVVSKSYPDYWKDLERLGLHIEYEQ